MINLKNFIKTVTVFAVMVTITPDAKPMDWAYRLVFGEPIPKFNEQNLTTLCAAQEYTALRPLFETYLAGAQNDAAFKLIQKIRTQSNDQYALYMDIFNFVDKRRKKCPVGPGEIAYGLKSMVFQMLQLPGEIACCLARGDIPPAARMEVYELFRTTYSYWFETYLCQDKELFDLEEKYEYATVLEGALAFKRCWDEQKIAAPHAVWVRHCKPDTNAKYRIHFDTPAAAEHTGFETEEGMALDARERRQCWDEAVRIAAGCKTWEAFFNLKLESLIPVQLGKLLKVRKTEDKRPAAASDKDKNKDEGKDPKDKAKHDGSKLGAGDKDSVDELADGTSKLSLGDSTKHNGSKLGTDSKEPGKEKEKEEHKAPGKKDGESDTAPDLSAGPVDTGSAALVKNTGDAPTDPAKS